MAEDRIPPPVHLNDASLGHHWIRLKLRGEGWNRDAIGAQIELVSGGVTQRRQVMPTRSYLSQSELPVTFGLGQHDAIDSLLITWPDGTSQEVGTVVLDQLNVIEKQ